MVTKILDLTNLSINLYCVYFFMNLKGKILDDKSYSECEKKRIHESICQIKVYFMILSASLLLRQIPCITYNIESAREKFHNYDELSLFLSTISCLSDILLVIGLIKCMKWMVKTGQC